MNEKEKAVLSLINRFIMDAKFLDNDNQKEDSIFRNLLSSKQITPLPVSIKIDTDGLVFSSKHFEVGKMNIKYDSIAKVEFTVYSRLVPTNGAAMNFPTTIYPINIKLQTHKGVCLEFESSDYSALKNLILKLQESNISICEQADLVNLMIKSSPDEIIEYFQSNWDYLVETYSLKSLKTGYDR